eukprot:TRINITY_DN39316_c0_g1_i1.p1 TRINITY_DN39316_c0_g1~~TRINITY_DN39316_c0_g1_i1.p1  ORF type:complete len:540 (-),score=135.56 TRINITY_DN39316_c0_g1_i1:60-1679(-)
MGNRPPTLRQELANVRQNSKSRISIAARYHLLPRKLEDDYEVSTTELGTGFNGSVFLAKSKHNEDSYAIKPFKLKGLSKGQQTELKHELSVFLCMDHPHVARLCDVYEGEDQLRMVMECLAGGELFARVSELGIFDERGAAHATNQMLLAVNYLHHQDIVHRDIKCENFMYDAKGSDHLKLIDFGFSRFHRSRNKAMTMLCGTLNYTAPEVLDKSYTNKCDLWSLGVIVFILLMGYMPFKGSDAEVTAAVKACRYNKDPEMWGRLSPACTSFIERLLESDPLKRPSAEEALQDPWILGRDSLAQADAPMLDKSVVDSLLQFSHASSFRKACMHMVAWSSTNEQRANLRKEFLKMDSDGSGSITLVELKQVLEAHVEISDAELRRIFAALDHNNTQTVNYSDFLAATMSNDMYLSDDKMLENTFRRFDVGGTGYITKDNLRSILGRAYDGSKVEQLIQEADISGDGKIDFEEFCAYMRDGCATEEQMDALKKVDDLDTDANIAEEAARGPTAQLTKQASAPAGPPQEQRRATTSRSCAIS